MRRPKVLSSGAFRFGMLFAAIFAVGAIVLVVAVGAAVNRYAAHATATALTDESLLLRSEARAHGIDALRDLIVRRERIVQAHQYLYLLLDSEGRRIVGDLPQNVTRSGWGDVAVPEPAGQGERSDGQADIRTYGVRLADGSSLIVGRNTASLEELADWLRQVTLWSGLGITALAAGGGLLIASVLLRRLDAVNGALQRIMAGRLDERVPSIGMGEEFQRLSQNLNLMLDRIETLMDGLRQVSTDIAHDLRTPLGRLRQHLDDMRELSAPQERELAIEEALAQVDSVLATFHALLRIGQIEGGVGKGRFEPVDLSELLERVRLAYTSAAEDAGHSLSGQIASGVVVMGDAQLLTQLFVNLLENALRHAGDAASIVLGLMTADGHATAVVADNGPGVPAGELSQVLGRFYRLDRSRSTAGSGLGLALVSAIADLHGAVLSLADNHPGLRIEIKFEEEPRLA